MAAVFWRAERFEKLDGGHFWLSETPDVAGSRGWDAALPRVATWVKLKDRRSGAAKPLLFLNAHFDHKGAKARTEAAKLLRRRADELGRGCSVVVTGDFNAGDGQRALQGAVRCAGGHEGASPRHVPRGPQERAKDEGTFNGFKPDATGGDRIDWIGCSRDWSVVRAAIDRTTRDGRVPSDHFPVTAVLRR
jgi:endonuclease/exonuclease/phosphatase family metal-dependent hydrolase